VQGQDRPFDQQLLKVAPPARRSCFDHDPGIAIIAQHGIFGHGRAEESTGDEDFDDLRRSYWRCSRRPCTPRRGGPQGEDKKKTDQRPPVDENAYKAALERIPDSKEEI